MPLESESAFRCIAETIFERITFSEAAAAEVGTFGPTPSGAGRGLLDSRTERQRMTRKANPRSFGTERQRITRKANPRSLEPSGNG